MTNMITIPFCHASHYSIYTPWVREGFRTLTSYPKTQKGKTNQRLGRIFKPIRMVCAIISGAIMGMLGQGLYLSIHYYLCTSFHSKFTTRDSVQAAKTVIASLLIGGLSECILVHFTPSTTLGIIPLLLGAFFPLGFQKLSGIGQHKEKQRSTF